MTNSHRVTNAVASSARSAICSLMGRSKTSARVCNASRHVPQGSTSFCTASAAAAWAALERWSLAPPACGDAEACSCCGVGGVAGGNGSDGSSFYRCCCCSDGDCGCGGQHWNCRCADIHAVGRGGSWLLRRPQIVRWQRFHLSQQHAHQLVQAGVSAAVTDDTAQGAALCMGNLVSRVHCPDEQRFGVHHSVRYGQGDPCTPRGMATLLQVLCIAHVIKDASLDCRLPQSCPTPARPEGIQLTRLRTPQLG